MMLTQSTNPCLAKLDMVLALLLRRPLVIRTVGAQADVPWDTINHGTFVSESATN